jgi:phospholipase A1
MRYSPHLKSFILVALFSFISAHAQSDMVVNKECLDSAIESATDDTTIGELKAGCETPQAAEPDLVAERLQQDKENTLSPFTIIAHRPNYVLFAAYNDNKNYNDSFQEAFNGDEERLDDTEAQFQLSLKVPLATNLFNKNMDVYGAYTVRSFWQVYNVDESSPFRETNHEPEVWLQTYPNWSLFGLKNSVVQFGLNHQSNGRNDPISRSWNRVFANFIFEKENFALSFKPWDRISEDSDDDNPDITDFMGHYELRGVYKTSSDHTFSLMSRNNLESGFDEGAVEASWSFPLGNYPYLKGYVQYFGGYGESLIDYDQKVNRIGIGIMLTDYL